MPRTSKANSNIIATDGGKKVIKKNVYLSDVEAYLKCKKEQWRKCYINGEKKISINIAGKWEMLISKAKEIKYSLWDMKVKEKTAMLYNRDTYVPTYMLK